MSDCKKDGRLENTVMLRQDLGGDSDYRLLAVDDALLEQVRRLSKEGGRLCLKGKAGQGAMLCTEDKTFKVQRVENTNTLLVAPRVDAGPQVVVASLGQTFELLPTPPPLEHLRQILRESEVGEANLVEEQGEGCEEPAAKRPRRGHTTSELENIVPCSNVELRKALADTAVQHDGLWCSVSEGLLDECLESLLRIGGAELDLMGGFTWAQAEGSLGDLHPIVAVRGCVTKFCSRAPGGDEKKIEVDPDATKFVLSPERVAGQRARQLLDRNASWGFESFMEQWTALCPPGVKPQKEWLGGRARLILTETGAPRQVKKFEESLLPRDPARRFTSLFGEEKRWTREDIEPYLNPIAGTGQSVDQLLRQHTRKYKVGDSTVYVPRW
eukprot:Hpha_TRINITY_DN9940_c0_g1::TRINITY_DN9940_c0_g1_i1::g.140526::m.140526/K11271/DSCC1, DCC1; sister chromatid cohesion protein DCC1